MPPWLMSPQMMWVGWPTVWLALVLNGPLWWLRRCGGGPVVAGERQNSAPSALPPP
jgi:hypothetical protein